MLILNDTVILNFPKTGSSFVRKVIKDIHKNRINKNLIKKTLLKLKLIQLGYFELMTEHPTIVNYKDQHGCFDQIPLEHKNKQIISVVRNPYERLESLYKFRWWAKNPTIGIEMIKERFPNFPKLTIDQFIQMEVESNIMNKKKNNISNSIYIGNQTI